MRTASWFSSLSTATLGACLTLFAGESLGQYSVTILPAPPGSGFTGARALGAWTGVQVGAIRNGTSEGNAALWLG